MNKERQHGDVHNRITQHIVAAIERGAPRFEMPWHQAGTDLAWPTNARTGRPYRGVNTLSLWVSASAQAFFSSHWATYRQWQQLDVQVRKGEKASPIVFYKEMVREVRDEGTGERTEERYLMARASWVFNADQVDGWRSTMEDILDPVETAEEVEVFIAATGAEIRHGGGRAYYAPSDDIIAMPERRRFTGTATSTATEGYYATLLHELTHWTAHPSRLKRDLSGRFGSEAYAMEELIAELGAAFLCAELSISNVPRKDHAAYVASWLKVLKSDSRAVFMAAGKASGAVRYLSRFREDEKCPRTIPIGPIRSGVAAS